MNTWQGNGSLGWKPEILRDKIWKSSPVCNSCLHGIQVCKTRARSKESQIWVLKVITYQEPYYRSAVCRCYELFLVARRWLSDRELMQIFRGSVQTYAWGRSKLLREWSRGKQLVCVDKWRVTMKGRQWTVKADGESSIWPCPVGGSVEDWE